MCFYRKSKRFQCHENEYNGLPGLLIPELSPSLLTESVDMRPGEAQGISVLDFA